MSDELLNQYVELLKKWQLKVNLISPTTISEIWDRHIIDSTQLAEHIPSEATVLVDIGSGGGLPGIPLAIQTKLPTFLVESDRKKCLFLQEVSRQLKLDKVKVINERVESAKFQPQPAFLAVSARALAPLTKLFDLIKTLLENNHATGYRLILPKGKNVQEEIEEAKKTWNFQFKTFKSRTDNASSILVVDHIEKK
jgi:16S rRNA (guanine527-N7)-methyltransferase